MDPMDSDDDDDFFLPGFAGFAPRRLSEAEQLRKFEEGIYSIEKLRQNDPSAKYLTLECKRSYDQQLFYRFCSQLLTGNTSLRDLSLDKFEVDSVEDAQFLAQLIGQTKVESLSISYGNRSHPRVLSTTLLCAVLDTRTSSLTSLTIKGDIENLGQRAFDSINLNLLAQALNRNTNIEKLELQACGSFEEGGGMEVLFGQGLRHNQTLTHLEFMICGIGNEGVRSMVEHWHPDSPIKSLTLKNEFIGVIGVRLLMHAARNHPALTTLDLPYDVHMGLEGLRLIGEELATQPYLTHMDISWCSSTVVHKNESVKAHKKASKQAGQALVEGVKANYRIRELNVSDNALSRDVEKKIGFYTCLNRTGRYLLSTNHHGLAPAVWSFILAKCGKHGGYYFETSLIFFYLREQPNLVHPPPLNTKKRPSCHIDNDDDEDDD